MRPKPNGWTIVRTPAACAVILLFPAFRAVATTPFRNLDFESAVVGTTVPAEVPASQALPNWTFRSYHAGMIWYDGIALDSPCVSIHDSLSGDGLKAIRGNYSVVLQDGWNTSPGPYDAWISQIGDVPGTANSLMFITDSAATIVTHSVVSLNDTAIPMRLYSAGGLSVNGRELDTYIGDIRAFSGQAGVALKFDKTLQNPSDPSGTHGLLMLDAIQFSPIVVPEPSALVLLAVALLSLAGCGWWFRRSR